MSPAASPAAQRPNAGHRVVVDGSNLATEGRNTPSLAQLDEAVRSFHSERPDDEIIVVVDASFGYRIDESERKIFEEAEEAGEIVSPPAGAIGRGDGFLLRIADRIGADVLSNDSFQEFHGEYLWLFEEGRLVGGKPVPGVGWIFTPRTPVRGPKSRVATRDADRARKRTAVAAAPRPEPTSAAIAEATAEAIAPDAPKAAKRGSRRRSGRSVVEGAPEAVNEPLPFITFIADHPLGSEVEGVVEGFTSHGAFVTAGGARCYAPVSGLGDPPPRSAKEVLTKGEVRSFVIQALDPPRRGIELALPGLAKVAGAPTEETVEAEIDDVAAHASSPDADAPPARRSRRKAAPAGEPAGPAVELAVPMSAEMPAPKMAPPRPRRAGTARPAAPSPEAEAVVVAAAVLQPELPAPAKARRGRKAPAGAAVVEAEVVEPVTSEAPTAAPESGPARPARPRRSTVRSAPEPEPTPATPVRRTRKKAAAPPVEPVGVPIAAAPPAKKATRSRKKAATSVEPADAVPVAAVTVAAVPVAAVPVAAVPVAAVPVAAAVAPRKAIRARKKAVTPVVVEEPVAVKEPVVAATPAKKATRGRKKTATAVEEPAPARKAAKKRAKNAVAPVE